MGTMAGLIDARNTLNGTWLHNLVRPYCVLAAKPRHRVIAFGNALSLERIDRYGLEWLDKYAKN